MYSIGIGTVLSMSNTQNVTAIIKPVRAIFMSCVSAAVLHSTFVQILSKVIKLITNQTS